MAQLLQQALEAAVHGALRYRSIQLLVRQGRLSERAHVTPRRAALWPHRAALECNTRLRHMPAPTPAARRRRPSAT